MGDFSKAIEYYEQALLSSREVGDKKAEAIIITNLASIYEKIGDQFVQQSVMSKRC